MREFSGLFIGKRPDAALFEPVSMSIQDGHRSRGKPRGGLWTCPDAGDGRSAWVDWCRNEGPSSRVKHRRLWRVVARDPRVYTIKTLADLKRAITRYPHQRYPDSQFLRDEYEIDFEAMAADYDAVYLTEEGQGATRLSYPVDLYGWDVPSILWLRWMFDRVEPVRRRRAA